MKRIFPWQQRHAFTLIEILVSMAILTLLLLVLVSITESTRRTWSYTNSKIEEFRNAREAFESVTRKLSQATLNTYWDYHYPNNDTTQQPDAYIRQSELRFISGNAYTLTAAPNKPTHAMFFQAPLGFVDDQTYAPLQNLLNTWGFFIEFGSDSAYRPGFFSAMSSPPKLRYRFRLMELMEPSDALSLYAFTSGTDSSGAAKTLSYTAKTWFTQPLNQTSRPVRPLAENIVALIILPKLPPAEQASGGYTDASLASSYLYDSTGTDMTTLADSNLNPKNQLPPVVQVTMVAVDETSFNRFQTGTAMPDFTSGLFTDATKYSDDMKTLQSTLQKQKLNYRVFTTNVSLKAAKWSREQAH